MLLRDSFQINIVIASRGERGLSPEPSQETGKIREKEARNAANYLNANLFFLGQTDGDVYADKYAVDSLVKIIKALGMDEYLTKPVKKDVFEALKGALNL